MVLSLSFPELEARETETLLRSGHVCLKIWDVTIKGLVGWTDESQIYLYLVQGRAVSV